MSDFYIVKLGGSQQKLAVGSHVTIDSVGDEKQVGSRIEVPEILLSSVGDEVVMGAPLIEGLTAVFEVQEHLKGEKIEVRKFRAKSRYHRKTGFRAHLTTLKLVEVNGGKSEAKSKPAKADKPVPAEVSQEK